MFASAEPIAPQELSKYSLKYKLASGGMGSVWLASIRGPRGFEKEVVLKTMLPAHAENAELVDMFAQEAAITAKLSHPGIVQIYDFGAIDNVFFIEMEYVVGCTYRQLMLAPPRRLDLRSLMPLLHVIAECCDAIQYLHTYCDEAGRRLGLLHRDISPENIMVTLTGHSKLLDFGVATSSAAVRRTRQGLVKGKFAYMAPEAILGGPDSPQRDIYSLGVILYEVLTSQRPFSADNDADLLRRITSESPRPLRDLNPQVPEDIEQIAMKAMHPEVDQRHSSAGVLASELRSALRHRGLHLDRSELSQRVTGAFGARLDLPAPIRERHLSAVRRRSSVVDTGNDFELAITTAEMDLPVRSRASFDVFAAYSTARSIIRPRTEKSVFDQVAPSFTKPSFDGPPMVTQQSPEAADHFERGLRLLRKGDQRAALAEWQQASAAAPDNRVYRANLQRLKKRLEYP